MPYGCLDHLGRFPAFDMIALCARDMNDEVKTLAHGAGVELQSFDTSTAIVAIGVLVIGFIVLLRLVVFLATLVHIGLAAYSQALRKPYSSRRTLIESRIGSSQIASKAERSSH